MNHCFWRAPRIVRGGESFRGLGMLMSPKASAAGGWPPLKARPASSAIIAGSENIPLNAGS
jgi:hypothetical protein